MIPMVVSLIPTRAIHNLSRFSVLFMLKDVTAEGLFSGVLAYHT